MDTERWALWVIDYGAWLATYDPDGGDLAVAYPTGTVSVTEDPAQAIRFVDAGSALEFWRQPSQRTPRRPDGRPNRPLTAFTVEVRRIP